MYFLLKLCNRASLVNIVKTNFRCDIKESFKLYQKDAFTKSSEKLKNIKQSSKTFNFVTPSCFLSTFAIVKLAKCHQINTKSTVPLTIKKIEREQESFPWREFFQFLKPYYIWLIGVICATFSLAFLAINIPLMLGEVVNVLVKFIGEAASSENFIREISKPALKLIGLYGIQGLLTTLCISLLFNVGENLASDLKKQLFNAMIVQDIQFFDRNKASDLIHRLTVDIQEFKSSFKLCISQGLKNVVQTTGCIISMAIISPKLTLCLVGLISLLIAGGSLIGSGLRILSSHAQIQLSKSSLIAEEAIGNVRTVRAFASEDHEMINYTKATEKASDLYKILGYGIAIFQGLSNVALNGLVLSTLCIGGIMISRDELSAGGLMSFLVASEAIQKSLTKLSVMYGITIQGLTSGARVFEFMLLPTGTTLKGNRMIPHQNLHCDIEFKNVTFNYPTREEQQVLEKFSLAIQGGQKVALVGPSGGGKSTVVGLLERLYEIESGEITIDGINLRDLDPSWVRGKLIGYIGQEPVLFATTIRENIRYGRPNAQDHEIVEAARLANAHDFIMSFPDGYDTILGERGQSVSGGQKQRIAIARALIKDPPILVLDEATSALDVESEKLIQDSIDRISDGRTLIIVAHRLSTIKDVDLVAVVSNGKIVEIGNPEELKRQKGMFWNLIKDQQ